MKLKFKSQSFQTDAVAAVVDLFKGQSRRVDTFTIVNTRELHLETGFGICNTLELSDEQIAANMREIQKRHSLPTTPLSNATTAEKGIARSFCIEMETGTGKTYVYTKTLFELHRQYGFAKFIIVVPSVAIREGVYKSLQTTAEHFAAQYDNTPARWFIYDSKEPSQVRQFASSGGIEIMIINIDAFKKSENIINQELDKLNGETAMSYIRATRPMVIIDEPQSVDNTPKSREAIASLNPLCVFRYSATHREKINLLYRLTPVDAYQMGLVKQICVSSNQIENDFNRPYIRLVSVAHENGFTARLEIDKAAKSGKVDRKVVTVKPGADLFEVSGGREFYRGYTLAGIDCQPGFECVEFSNSEMLQLGKAFGDVDENLVKRAQIRRTIEAHLEKELRYLEKGIKVLSLFFIDEVARYRAKGAEDGAVDAERGIYARMFEENYLEAINKAKYEVLRERFHGTRQPLAPEFALNTIHDGYFSQDKKGNLKNTRGDTADDTDTYSIIMKDKERLLSFECPLRFIFSHSALKEGWDNPNVFQVCTLIEQRSAFTARQKVGRGLRLCVNQDGDRIEDRNTNILHVMANESFAEFADNLQREIEQETGVKFGILQLSLFNGLTYLKTVVEDARVTPEQAVFVAEQVAAWGVPGVPPPVAPSELAPVIETAVAAAKMGATVTPEKVSEMTYSKTREVEQAVTYDDARELFEHLEKKGYVGKSGAIKDTLRHALATGTLELPEKFETAREKIETTIARADARPTVRDASKEIRVRLKKEVMVSPEFLELWKKIKGRTTYRVRLDEAELKARCIAELAKRERVAKAQIVSRTARIHVEQSGVSHTETELRTTGLDNEGHRLPDFLRMVENDCVLTRRLAAEILIGSGRVPDFLNNPQRTVEIFIEAVRHVQNTMEIDGIRYLRLDGREYFLQEIFDSGELAAFLDRNAVAVERSLYDHVVYDSSTVERPFAVALDNDPDVKLFFKIPEKFKIETPVGTYNPDWAVHMEKNGEEKLYFVLETKGGTLFDGLRTQERQKIHCGQQHFTALESGVEMRVAKDWWEFKRHV